MIELVDRWSGTYGRRAVAVVVVDPSVQLPESEIAWYAARVPMIAAGSRTPREIARYHGRTPVDRWLRYYEARIVTMTPSEDGVALYVGWVGVADRRLPALPLPLAAYRRRTSRISYTRVYECSTWALGFPPTAPCMPQEVELPEAAILEAVYARAVQEFMVLR